MNDESMEKIVINKKQIQYNRLLSEQRSKKDKDMTMLNARAIGPPSMIKGVGVSRVQPDEKDQGPKQGNAKKIEVKPKRLIRASHNGF